MSAVLLALGSACAYGVSDFVGGVAARRVRADQVLAVAYPVSAVLMTVLALGVPARAGADALAIGAASGVSMAAGMGAFYVALRRGPMSVICPLTALVAAALPIGVGLAGGERLGTGGWLGIGAAAAAVVLVSLASDAGGSGPALTRSGLALALVAGAGFAVSFVLVDAVPVGTGLWPLASARWAASIAVLAVSVGLRGAAPRPAPAAMGGRTLAFAAAVGALDVAALVAMMRAFQAGALAVSSTLVSLYPAVTVAMAVLLLGERLSSPQRLGLGLGGAAVALIGFAG